MFKCFDFTSKRHLAFLESQRPRHGQSCNIRLYSLRNPDTLTSFCAFVKKLGTQLFLLTTFFRL